MSTDSKTVTNSSAGPIEVIFEPWSMPYMLPAGQSFRMVARSDRAGQLEVRRSGAGIEIYAWPGATLQVWNGTTLVDDFDRPVPELPPNMTTREFVDLLLGRPKRAS